MQFHIEIDEEKISYWISEDDEKWANCRSKYNSVQESTEILNGIEHHLSNHQKTADHIYDNWFKTVLL